MNEEDAVKKVLEATGFSMSDMASDKRTKITVHDLFLALILLKDRCLAADSLGITKSKLEYILNTRISPLVPKVKQERWHVHLLGLAGLRRCATCDQIKDISEFVSDVSRTSGVTGYCKPCACKSTSIFKLDNPDYHKEYRRKNPEQHREYGATYRATKDKLTPSWANLEKIKEIYNNCPKGMHVDHIIPLRGRLVSGLHVENNLQYLTPSENFKKSNSFKIVEHT